MEQLTFTARVITDGEDDFVFENGYAIVTVGPGARTWVRNTIESPFMHGSFTVSKRLGQGQVPLVVLVYGDTMTEVATRTAALLAVMERPVFTFEAVIDGVTFQWACECADSAPGAGGAFDDARLGNYQQYMTFQVPRNPIPLAGAL